MFADSRTNNALLFFSFPFYLKFGTAAVLKSSSPSGGGVLTGAWKHLLLLSLKYLKYRALFQTGNTKEGGGEWKLALQNVKQLQRW